MHKTDQPPVLAGGRSTQDVNVSFLVDESFGEQPKADVNTEILLRLQLQEEKIRDLLMENEVLRARVAGLENMVETRGRDIAHIARRVTALENPAIQPSQKTKAHIAHIEALLRKNGPMTPKDIANQIGVSRPRAWQLIDLMLAEGMVDILRHSRNKRLRLIRLRQVI